MYDSALKWRTTTLLCLAELHGMGVWFSASAVVPALGETWALSEFGRAWLTMSVQVGFVAGASGSPCSASACFLPSKAGSGGIGHLFFWRLARSAQSAWQTV